jgi:hypothetical protein
LKKKGGKPLGKNAEWKKKGGKPLGKNAEWK